MDLSKLITPVRGRSETALWGLGTKVTLKEKKEGFWREIERKKKDCQRQADVF
jgi:hypothetical protein